MAAPSLSALADAATRATDPSLTAPSKYSAGGVDPLGMRQINFDLMDEVLPGLNNVARHVRPFVVVTWAWRRARQLAEASGDARVSADVLRNFVDRVEVLYVASQITADSDVDLPGKDYLEGWLNASSISFDGQWWEAQRKHRRDSTSLSAAINYGPGLRSFGWIVPHHLDARVMVTTNGVEAALDSFEESIRPLLRHRAFNTLEGVTVSRDTLDKWAASWSFNTLTHEERSVMAGLLMGPSAPIGRQLGFRLMLQAAKHSRSSAHEPVRAAMSGAPSAFIPATDLLAIRDAWRRVQVRQLFRFSLEAVHHWIILQLQDGPRSMDSLVASFLTAASRDGQGVSRAWLSEVGGPHGPTELMDRIRTALKEDNGDLIAASCAGIALSLSEPASPDDKLQAPERLPLLRARRDAEAKADGPTKELVRHILESWVLAQHAYWSVGRGLADARAGGKVLLRLKVILDEGGWTLTPGAKIGNPPEPTRDRLATALSLARECDLLD